MSLRAAGRRGPRGSSVADTYQTLIGLLATTGLRVGEALRLQIGDCTPQGLAIRETKFRKSRLVPLHATTHDALRAYCARWRSQADPAEPLIVSIHGTALHYNSVLKMFRKLLRAAGLPTSAGPIESRMTGFRIHDLRHTYAVRALETCPDGRDAIRRHMLALTTALGHASVSATYWYLHVSPQLMTDIADACEALDLGGAP
ncbi:MAG: tyrosine-type recombinase/integrase [Deltaproteobacteria bacterium]|nr:tyrosine-type recombinase/integrase [Deltaproteobacteria bacterium]